MIVRAGFLAMLSLTFASAATGSPQIFGGGVISMPVNVAAPAFAPDGATVYFQRGDGLQRTIYVSSKRGDAWSTPVAAPFADQWMNIEPAFAPDGSYIVFASDRPIDASGKVLDWNVGGKVRAGRGSNLWRVDRSGSGWSAPRRLPANVNDGPAIFAPAVADDGTLFFMKDLGGGTFHLYEARPNGASYEPAEPLPFSRQGASDIDPAVSKDGSYIVFGSDRDASAPSNAYIAFRTSRGWTAPLRLPDDSGIGNAIEFRLSPDENTLYFSRDGSIWSVPFAALREQLRNLAKP